jgi:hypothetical protein
MPVTGQRKALSHLYRPQGPKLISTLVATPGTVPTLIQSVDLTVPIRGFRLVMKGRLVVGTAAFTTANPEHFLNLISNILIQGISKRQGGNVILWNIGLAELFAFSHMSDVRGGIFTINNQTGGEVQQFAPSTPLVYYGFQNVAGVATLATGFNGATGTYDYKVTIDLPAYPIDAPPGVRSGYILRQDEFKDSLQFKFTFTPSDTNATPQGLGTPGATSTLTFTAYGSGSGSPTLDVYALPIVLGDLRNSILPGVIQRSVQPVSGLVQSTANNIELLRMQKQATPRVFMKTGVVGGTGFYTSVSDAIVTAVGIQLGTDRNVRDVLDIFSHKHDQVEHYGTPPIQGYTMLDFVQSGNSDASYPGDELGDGTTYRIVGNVTGAANQQALFYQEQILYKPEGQLAGG